MATVEIITRIALTATPSAPFLSPRPTHRAAAPYRWLEDPQDPRTVAWSAAQDELFAEHRARWPGRERVAADALGGDGCIGDDGRERLAHAVGERFVDLRSGTRRSGGERGEQERRRKQESGGGLG